MENASNTTTIIGSDVELEGPVLRFAGPVHVLGSVVGDVVIAGELVVGTGGSIVGDVRARSAQVGGLLKGDIECSRFDILSTGSIEGVIRAERWSVEPGAVIQAEFVHAKRSEFAASASEVERAYAAALKLASELSGNEYRPSDDFLAWAKRLDTATKPRSDEIAEKTESGEVGGHGDGSAAGRFADTETVGRLAWSKSVDDPRSKRIWPRQDEDEAPDLFNREGSEQGRPGDPGVK